MSDRKVLNQYIPVDYDPSLIPKGLHKRPHQYKTRVMLPFNVQCTSCNHFMYRGRKFNAKKETSDQKYLGISIFRFYLRCENCANEITFLTDPQNFNYTLERGAVRMFEYALEKEQALRKIREEKERDEKGDVMKMLENRTLDSLRERQLVETLDELEDLRKQQEFVNVLDAIENRKKEEEDRLLRQQREFEEEDEAEISRLFGGGDDALSARNAQLVQLTSTVSRGTVSFSSTTSTPSNDDELEEYESEDEDSMMFGAANRDEAFSNTINTLKLTIFKRKEHQKSLDMDKEKKDEGKTDKEYDMKNNAHPAKKQRLTESVAAPTIPKAGSFFVSNPLLAKTSSTPASNSGLSFFATKPQPRPESQPKVSAQPSASVSSLLSGYSSDD